METAKTEILTALEVNVETGEETVRQLTTEEIAEFKAQGEAFAAKEAETLARQQALEALIQAQLNA